MAIDIASCVLAQLREFGKGLQKSWSLALLVGIANPSGAQPRHVSIKSTTENKFRIRGNRRNKLYVCRPQAGAETKILVTSDCVLPNQAKSARSVVPPVVYLS
ncbi:MAG: hypothetical protein OXF88_02155 [Rhodobacteraceae bacterium]|nr:hypothetical protein [Paracoccaceae bacterium]MCY4137755.1 hypothetical protein [Paracoccaceae bacterium]